ncbi:hypothetical protein P8625_02305 [Tenacibaculum tangerinum]|uniref:Uncharacterized protein n=1 Tax=Tenacibaculum tangerinum TaxID=3038772 RepID=A0ABY8L5X4_9FLAO|nr:hypothetical protein [Tenacibaculum tangerinum]WGH76022.1 hypothetical protein P8625_02305 [Tenacibaculum tangerinum]
MTTFFVVLAISVYMAIFIFGYREDYKRNPKEFFRTLVAMPVGMFLSYFGFKKLEAKLKKWTEEK